MPSLGHPWRVVQALLLLGVLAPAPCWPQQRRDTTSRDNVRNVGFFVRQPKIHPNLQSPDIGDVATAMAGELEVALARPACFWVMYGADLSVPKAIEEMIKVVEREEAFPDTVRAILERKRVDFFIDWSLSRETDYAVSVQAVCFSWSDLEHCVGERRTQPFIKHIRDIHDNAARQDSLMAIASELAQKLLCPSPPPPTPLATRRRWKEMQLRVGPMRSSVASQNILETTDQNGVFPRTRTAFGEGGVGLTFWGWWDVRGFRRITPEWALRLEAHGVDRGITYPQAEGEYNDVLFRGLETRTLLMYGLPWMGALRPNLAVGWYLAFTDPQADRGGPDLRRLDHGLAYGGGVEIKASPDYKLIVEVRRNHGVRDLFHDDMEFDVENRSTSLTAGVSFDVGRIQWDKRAQ